MYMNILWFKDCSYENKQLVGGKNASLGELYHLSKKLDFRIANGFAITTTLYDEFINHNNLSDNIENLIKEADIEDMDSLNNLSNTIKNLFNNAVFLDNHIEEIIKNN